MTIFRGATQYGQVIRGTTPYGQAFRGTTLVWTSDDIGFLSLVEKLVATQAAAATTTHTSLSVPVSALSALVFTNSAGDSDNSQDLTPTCTFNGGAATGTQLVGSDLVSTQTGRARMDAWICPVVGGSSTTLTYTNGAGDTSVAAGATIYYFDVAYVSGDFTTSTSFGNLVNTVAVHSIGPTLSSIGLGTFGQSVGSREVQMSSVTLSASNWTQDSLGRTTGASAATNYVFRGKHTESLSADLTPEIDFDKSGTGNANLSYIYVTKT